MPLSAPPVERELLHTRDIALRIAAKDTEPLVGVIESGTDTYVLDVMAGWASMGWPWGSASVIMAATLQPSRIAWCSLQESWNRSSARVNP